MAWRLGISGGESAVFVPAYLPSVYPFAASTLRRHSCHLGVLRPGVNSECQNVKLAYSYENTPVSFWPNGEDLP